MAGDQETELTLGTAKLLGLFFALVAVCGVFFSLGYVVGRGSTRTSPDISDALNTSTTTPVQGGSKPAALKAAAPVTEAAPCTASDPNCTPTQTDAGSNELSFIKPSEQKQPPSEAQKEPVKNAAAPELQNQPFAGYMVQVAAVSKQEDADALVGALRKKQYPVLVVNNMPNSKLFHVQVGPFAQLKDAEAMRSKLAGDGYNAILKK
jgi:DedD protein